MPPAAAAAAGAAMAVATAAPITDSSVVGMEEEEEEKEEEVALRSHCMRPKYLDPSLPRTMTESQGQINSKKDGNLGRS
jgi:hypothetical protein